MFGKKKAKKTLIDQTLFDNIGSYVDESLRPKPVEDKEIKFSRELNDSSIRYSLRNPEGVYNSLLRIAEMGGREPTFTEELQYFINLRHYSSVTCYKKAHIDRKLFSQIMKNREYKPKKATVIAFIMALELNMGEANNLLCTAGYALSKTDKHDLIIRYCIEHKIYDLDDVNEILYHFDQPILGSK